MWMPERPFNNIHEEWKIMKKYCLMKWERELHTIIIREQLQKKCVRGCTLRKNLCVKNATQAIQKKEKKLWKYLHKNRRKQTQYLHKSLTLLCILHTTFISIKNSKIYSHFAFCAKCEGGSREGAKRVKRGERTPTTKNNVYSILLHFAIITSNGREKSSLTRVRHSHNPAVFSGKQSKRKLKGNKVDFIHLKSPCYTSIWIWQFMNWV